LAAWMYASMLPRLPGLNASACTPSGTKAPPTTAEVLLLVTLETSFVDMLALSFSEC
jgi:hypothetical protein